MRVIHADPDPPPAPRLAPRSVVAVAAALLVAAALAAPGCLFDPDPEEHAPRIVAIRAEPATLLPDSTSTVSVEADDEDGDPLDVHWSATAGGFPGGAGGSRVVWQAPATAGPCTLTAVVSDGAREASAELLIEVVPPAPLLALAPSAIDFGDTTTHLDLVVANTGTGELDWSIAAADDWLAVTPSSGSTAAAAPDTVHVEVTRGVLPPGDYESTIAVTSTGGDGTVAVTMRVATTPVYGYRVLQTYPHDPQAFTQGLVYHQGELLEGTGIRGASTLRRVALETGEVLQRVDLAPGYFGEGITLFEDRIIQLTWTARIALVYDAVTFDRIGDFTYPTQGWGLTHDGTRLIMSDGSSTIYFRDPETFEELGRISVTDLGTPVERLNELEFIDGEIYANVWLTDRIARISPETGQVLAWIDLTGLLRGHRRDARPLFERQDRVRVGAERQDVLNGIAHDAGAGRLFVTGKLWPSLFEIELVPPAR
jgi:glutamine cyclotransferase